MWVLWQTVVYRLPISRERKLWQTFSAHTVTIFTWTKGRFYHTSEWPFAITPQVWGSAVSVVVDSCQQHTFTEDCSYWELSPLPTNKDSFYPCDFISLAWIPVQCTSDITLWFPLWKKKKFFRITFNNVISEFTKIIYFVTGRKLPCDSLFRSLHSRLGSVLPFLQALLFP